MKKAQLKQLTLFCFSFFCLNTVWVHAENLLGKYDFPTGTASLAATEVNENIEMTDLTYTSNLTYDYNTGPGYFRPYDWPTGAKDDTKYLEFKIEPKTGMEVELDSLKIVHRPNTATLGPDKVLAAYSIDNGVSFIDLTEIVFDPNTRTSLTTSKLDITNLKTTDPIIFRLYAYESQHGTAAQKDLWIIDFIEVYGTAEISLPVEKNELLGKYDFPTGTASLAATEVNEKIEMTDLTYTSNLTYDYNTGPGYFRPYDWPTGAKDDTKYLEFKIEPKTGMEVELDSLKIVHRPNTATLGPDKVLAAYSTDNGVNFTDLTEIIFDPDTRTSLTTSKLDITNLKRTDPIIFRLYAYESQHGTAAQKDLWIIDFIEVYGTADISLPLGLNEQENIMPYCFIQSGNLHVSGIEKASKFTVFNMSGNIILEKTINSGEVIPFDYPGVIFIVKIDSDVQIKTVKVTKQ